MDTRKDYVSRIQAYYERSDEKPRVQSLLRELFKGQPYKKVLDVGAGPGELSAVLSELCDELVLLEIEEKFAKQLKERFPKAKVVNGTLTDISVDEKFDLILLSHVLYYFPEAEWVGIVKRLLEQSERLVLIQNADKGDWWETVQHFKPKLGADSAFYNQPWTLFKKKLSKAVVSKPYSYKVSYKNLEDLVSYIGRSCLAIHNEEVLAKMDSEIRKFCQEKLKAKSGPGFLTYESEILILSPARNKV